MVRCQNDANAGPFGGCVPVQMVQPAAAATEATGATNATAKRSPKPMLKLPRRGLASDPAFIQSLIDDGEEVI
jgi:hypothetical protein